MLVKVSVENFKSFDKAAEVRTATGNRISVSYHCRWN